MDWRGESSCSDDIQAKAESNLKGCPMELPIHIWKKFYRVLPSLSSTPTFLHLSSVFLVSSPKTIIWFCLPRCLVNCLWGNTGQEQSKIPLSTVSPCCSLDSLLWATGWVNECGTVNPIRGLWALELLQTTWGTLRSSTGLPLWLCHRCSKSVLLVMLHGSIIWTTHAGLWDNMCFQPSVCERELPWAVIKRAELQLTQDHVSTHEYKKKNMEIQCCIPRRFSS